VQTRLEAVPLAAMSEFKRLSGGALLPYHFGRGTTYMALGAVGALATRQLAEIEALHWVAAALLAFAAVFFIGYAVRGLGIVLPGTQGLGLDAGGGEGTLARAWGRTIKPLFARPTGFRGYALGLALGFLPCGLLYGALAAAAAGGEWLTAFGMAAFWLGTTPALLGLGVAGGAILGRWPEFARQAAPVLLLVNGAFLFYLAWGML
jgi:sulfite exporter TauE/SafE